jgi:S-adenosylmethionine synthetase
VDAISVALSQEYLRQFGAILHHNIDKALLAAGSTRKKFGGGNVTKPMELIIGDRATFKIQSKKIPVKAIAVESAKQWFHKNLRFVDPEKDVRYRVVLAEGSGELTDIFSRAGSVREANDTSAAVGYYPLSPAERLVFELEKHLNSAAFKKRFPETGEDVKVMALRNKMVLDITVSMPLVARFIPSVAAYFERKSHVYLAIRSFLESHNPGIFESIQLHYNTLDRDDRGISGVYLTLLGTSAEDADSGQVGRGNRVNGLISMNRPLGTEAAAGKNPISHVGKIYNLLAYDIAKKIYRTVEGINEVYVVLLSQIGQPIDTPKLANARVHLKKGRTLRGVSKEVEGIFDQAFGDINGFCMEIANGKYPVC